MGEQWLKDFEKARLGALQLAQEVTNIERSTGKPEARQSALLRGNFAQLRQDVKQLEHSLMTMSHNTQAYGVTKKELSRRGDMLAQLSDQVEAVQDAIRRGARRRTEESSRGETWSEDTARRGGSMQQRSMEEVHHQEDVLDFLSGTVQNLKSMGGGISQELDLHCQMLSDIEDQTENARGKLKQQQGSLDILSAQSSTCILWLIIIVLSVILFILLVFF